MPKSTRSCALVRIQRGNPGQRSPLWIIDHVSDCLVQSSDCCSTDKAGWAPYSTQQVEASQWLSSRWLCLVFWYLRRLRRANDSLFTPPASRSWATTRTPDKQGFSPSHLHLTLSLCFCAPREKQHNCFHSHRYLCYMFSIWQLPA